jgi:hypothetical protein
MRVPMTRRFRFVTLARSALAAAVLVAGCSGAPAGTPSSVVDDGPVITAITREFEETWGPAWTPPAAVLAGFEGALRSRGILALLPGGPPSVGGSLSADVDITGTAPIDRPTVGVVVRRVDGSVFLSVQTTPVGTQAGCADRVGAPGDSGWTLRTIRGTTGCALLVEGAVSFIDWIEEGQFFHAEFGPGVDGDVVVAWLGEWHRVPAAENG